MEQSKGLVASRSLGGFSRKCSISGSMSSGISFVGLP
jgi:hypothetical protein